jgi:hypothetical protein
VNFGPTLSSSEVLAGIPEGIQELPLVHLFRTSRLVGVLRELDYQLHRVSGVSYFPALGPDEFAEARLVPSSVVFEGSVLDLIHVLSRTCITYYHLGWMNVLMLMRFLIYVDDRGWNGEGKMNDRCELEVINV